MCRILVRGRQNFFSAKICCSFVFRPPEVTVTPEQLELAEADWSGGQRQTAGRRVAGAFLAAAFLEPG